MNRDQKALVIADVKKLVTSSQATFLINYKGMSVAALQGLRKDLRGCGGQFKVVKATLMRRAALDVEGMGEFSGQFKDQVGLVFALEEPSSVAKALVDYEKKNDSLPQIVAGFYESKFLPLEQVKLIASLPSRDVLLAKLLGTMQAPISQFARLLHMLIARLLFVLKRIEEKNSQ